MLQIILVSHENWLQYQHFAFSSFRVPAPHLLQKRYPGCTAKRLWIITGILRYPG